jgi:ubiquinone/menaquinone biosynthesis C-methylase UbiE
MGTKDYFSDHAKAYAAFRPVYPEELYAFIFKHLKNRSLAWDCATGNGQVARYLCKHFKKVYATDISQQQLANAYRAENIEYSLSKAEDTNFPDDQFDLITVAQALHWIDTGPFYKEASRTSKADALLAVWGYSLLNIDPKVDQLIRGFYHDTVGPYWDAARKLVDEHYSNIPFPFEQIPAPTFHHKVSWTLEQFTGYVTSWSATQKYTKERGSDPVIDFKQQLQPYWSKEETKTVTFPLFLKLGRIHS